MGQGVVANAEQREYWNEVSGPKWVAVADWIESQLSEIGRLALEASGAKPGERVLDVGCGNGFTAIELARRVGETGKVLGLDLSHPMLKDAAVRAQAAGFPLIRFLQGDAQTERLDPIYFDLVFSRFGVMFFDDPLAAFANLARQAQPGASLMFSCFREVPQNPFFTEILRLLPERPAPSDPTAPGPFAFADQDRVIPILRAGGWDHIAFEKFDFPMIAGAGQDAVDEAVAYFSLIGPAARAAAEMEGAARERFFGRVRDLCERNCHEGIVALPAAAWIVSAKKAG